MSSTGSVYRTSDGRWRGSVVVGWRDGKPRRRYVSGRTKAETMARARAVAGARDAGAVDTAGTTVQAWLAYWVAEIADLRPRTREGYESKIRVHVLPVIGRKRLDKLTPADLERVASVMRVGGASPASILQTHRILARALKVAEQRGKVSRSPAALMDAPKAGPRRTFTPLTRDQARAVLAAAAGDRLAARWAVALSLGLRQGEALGLSWDRVDLDAGTLRIEVELQRQKGIGLVLADVKSQASHRTVHLPEQLVALLREHRHRQRVERVQEGPRWVGWTWQGQSVSLVFAQRNGLPIDARRDWATWKSLLVMAGAPDVRLHDARHTTATLLFEGGATPKAVQELLGHSQISLTLGIYTHVTDSVKQDTAGRIDRALWGTGT